MSEIKRVKIQSIVESQIPEFLNDDSPLFKEFLEQYERQSMLDKDFKKKFPTAADYVLDQRARLSGANAPAASSTSSGFSNFRISK